MKRVNSSELLDGELKIGNSEFEICTSNCKTGLPGSGSGQFKEPKEVWP